MRVNFSWSHFTAFSYFTFISMVNRLHYSGYFFSFCYFATTFLKFSLNHESLNVSFPFFKAAHASRMMMHMGVFFSLLSLVCLQKML